ncbi:hypothetical protein BOTNAR_0183g00170 [Botryotinia narcissicola]|uniref:Uncharacterized protein n=1 Tax=Botryotinia narcissicola TaxID=278944 RepID=A0A4Z1INN7_9HELO|nr:hypothetical protein BOTNAR_0183g00170 [Botryotinia narcissicola]
MSPLISMLFVEISAILVVLFVHGYASIDTMMHTSGKYDSILSNESDLAQNIQILAAIQQRKSRVSNDDKGLISSAFNHAYSSELHENNHDVKT